MLEDKFVHLGNESQSLTSDQWRQFYRWDTAFRLNWHATTYNLSQYLGSLRWFAKLIIDHHEDVRQIIKTYRSAIPDSEIDKFISDMAELVDTIEKLNQIYNKIHTVDSLPLSRYLTYSSYEAGALLTRLNNLVTQIIEFARSHQLGSIDVLTPYDLDYPIPEQVPDVLSKREMLSKYRDDANLFDFIQSQVSPIFSDSTIKKYWKPLLFIVGITSRFASQDYRVSTVDFSETIDVLKYYNNNPEFLAFHLKEDGVKPNISYNVNRGDALVAIDVEVFAFALQRMVSNYMHYVLNEVPNARFLLEFDPVTSTLHLVDDGPGASKEQLLDMIDGKPSSKINYDYFSGRSYIPKSLSGGVGSAFFIQVMQDFNVLVAIGNNYVARNGEIYPGVHFELDLSNIRLAERNW